MRRVYRIFEECKKLVGVPNAKLRLVSRAKKIASTSLRTRIVYLTKEVVPLLSDEELKYLIIHELIHLKYNFLHHSPKFFEEFYRYIPKEEADRIELSLMSKLPLGIGFWV